MSETPLMTVKEVTEFLRISRATLYRILNDGELRKYKVKGSLRFRREDVETYLRSQEKKE